MPEPGPTFDDLLAYLRAWVAHTYPGRRAVRLRIDLDDGGAIRLPMPADTAELANPCRHSPDFRSVSWHGADYRLTANQAAVVKVLWDAWAAGVPEVGQATLLEAADSSADRLRDVFRSSEVWGELVVPGRRRGTYRLYEPEGDSPP